jgi:hypothetical protein
VATTDRNLATTLRALALVAVLVSCAPPPDRSVPSGDQATVAAGAATLTPASPSSDETVDLVIEAPSPPPLDIAGTITSFWWHSGDMATRLSLRPDQVDAMDTAARSYLAGWTDAVQAQRDGPRQVAAALAADDLDAAMRAADRYAEALTYIDAGHQRLKISIVSRLDESQRQTLISDYPQLLRDPWVVGRRLGKPRRQRPR